MAGNRHPSGPPPMGIWPHLPASRARRPITDPAERATLSPEEDMANKRLLVEQQLVLILHAQRCLRRIVRLFEEGAPIDPCGHPYCDVMVAVIVHLSTCSVERDCQTPHCTSTRMIYNHWMHCTREDCPVCFRVRLIEPPADQQQMLPVQIAILGRPFRPPRLRPPTTMRRQVFDRRRPEEEDEDEEEDEAVQNVGEHFVALVQQPWPYGGEGEGEENRGRRQP